MEEFREANTGEKHDQQAENLNFMSIEEKGSAFYWE
jgi:hypothetical protein